MPQPEAKRPGYFYLSLTEISNDNSSIFLFMQPARRPASQSYIFFFLTPDNGEMYFLSVHTP